MDKNSEEFKSLMRMMEAARTVEKDERELTEHEVTRIWLYAVILAESSGKLPYDRLGDAARLYFGTIRMLAADPIPYAAGNVSEEAMTLRLTPKGALERVSLPDPTPQPSRPS